MVSALVVGTALLFFIGARALAPAGGSGPSQSASNAVTVPAPLEVPRASNGAALGGQVAGQVANQPSNQAMGQGQALAQPVAQTQHVEPPTSEAASEPTRLAPPNTATTTTTAPAARGAAAPDAGRAVVMPVKGASARTTHTSATGSNHDDDIPTMR